MPDHATLDWVSERTGLTAIALASAFLGLLVLLPYLQYVLFGVVLAYILLPLQRRLERFLRPTIAAIVVVVVTLLVVLIPLAYVVRIAVQQAFGVVVAIREGRLDVEMVEEALSVDGRSVDLVALYEANQGRIATALQEIATGAINLVGSLPSMFIGLTVTLFVLFALLRDGDRLVAWVRWVLPVEDRTLDDLFEGLDQLMWASVVGNVAVAAIQAVMLGVGLAIAGVPAVVFLTVATFVLTLVPLVGAFGVWIPAAAYLVAVGRPVAGAAMAAYGLVVTFSDSYLRPALIGQTAAFNSATIVVGIFGGLVAFGAVGLFVGPVVLGGAKIAIDCYARERTGEASAAPSEPTGGHDGPADGDAAVDVDAGPGDADVESADSEAGSKDADAGSANSEAEPTSADTDQPPTDETDDSNE